MGVAFVQAAAAGPTGVGRSTPITAVLGAPPTPGNLLICYGQIQNDQGVAIGSMAAGWDLLGSDLLCYSGGGGSGGPVGVWARIVQPGDAVNVAAVTNTVPGGGFDVMTVLVAEYSGFGPNGYVASGAAHADTLAGGATQYAAPSQTPPAGAEALLVMGCNVLPNYNPAWPAGWTVRAVAAGNNRNECQLGERIVPVASGAPYPATLTGAGGETAWHIFTVTIIRGVPKGGSVSPGSWW